MDIATVVVYGLRSFLYFLNKNENMEINQASPKFRETSIAPMHTVEHILNRTMVNLFGCGRAVEAHIEKKKSKCDYCFESPLSEEQIGMIERQVNEVISRHLPVTEEYISRAEASGRFDLSRLPEAATDTLRIVHVGDYDSCPCVGLHVSNTSEIVGKFTIISYDYAEGRLRLRFKLNVFD